MCNVILPPNGSDALVDCAVVAVVFNVPAAGIVILIVLSDVALALKVSTVVPFFCIVSMPEPIVGVSERSL